MNSLVYSNKYDFDRNLIDALTEGEVEQLLEHLGRVVLPERVSKMKEVLVQRTRHLQILVEDVQKIHNAHAVLRSAECMGLQDVHFSKLTAKKSKVAPGIVKGSHKWVDLHLIEAYAEEAYRNYLQTLKAKGFSLWAAEPSATSISLYDISVDQPLILLFGTEKHGLSTIASEEADAAYHIPMVGFTESFNVSVSAAISIQHILQRMKAENIPWQIPEWDQKYLLAKWMISDVHKPHLHLKQAFTKTSSS